MLTDFCNERFDLAIGAVVGFRRIRRFNSLAVLAVSRRVDLGMIRHSPLGADPGHSGHEPDGDTGGEPFRPAAPAH